MQRASPAASRRRPSVAVLLGSDLRAFDRFVGRLDALLADGEPSEAFISTDARSLACAHRHSLLPRRSVRWYGETPDTAAAISEALGPLVQGVSPHHLHQWWRLRDAWQAMEWHERERGGPPYERVVRLRSDMRLPSALQLAPAWEPLLRSPNAGAALVMRGDWVFWGAREAMRLALEYVDELPRFHRAGQRTYLPLPYRQMLAAGADGLSAGLFGWLRFPLQTADRPFHFRPSHISNGHALVARLRESGLLERLEAFDASGAYRTLRPQETFSARDSWWRWDGIPDNEKFFLYHVLNRSLLPRPMLDIYNRGAPPSVRVSFLGRKDGLLLGERERHHPNCTCVCEMAFQ